MLSVGCLVTRDGQFVVDNTKDYPEGVINVEGNIEFSIDDSLKCPYHKDNTDSWDSMECGLCEAYKEHVKIYLQIAKNNIVFCVSDTLNLKDNFTLSAYLDYKSAFLHCLNVNHNPNIIIICAKFQKDLCKLHKVTWLK